MFRLLQFLVIGLCTATETERLDAELQSILDHAAAVTGYGFSVGYVDTDGLTFGVAAGPRTTRGLPVPVVGAMTPNDTFVLGSGTKPYTAAGILRLVDTGVLHLEDKVAAHVDWLTRSMWNITLQDLYGSMVREVTLRHLIQMQSGLADIESVPGWEAKILQNGSVHDPLLDLQAVGGLSKSLGCRGCIWHFAPGSQTEYSSTNYLLAGLVLMAHSAPSQQHWRTFDQATSLGTHFKQNYPNTFFPTVGPLNKVGLTCAGNGFAFGRAEVYEQDASIMGLAWGCTTASAPDVARFYFDLLGPSHRIVSNSSLDLMQKWHLMTVGWDKGTKRYGAGLETNNPSPQVLHWRAPPLNHTATSFGHHGQTYGFEMLAGFYPALNASIAVMINQDKYGDGGLGKFESAVSCSVVQAVARYRGRVEDLNCTQVTPVGYICQKMHGGPTCFPVKSNGTSWDECTRGCHGFESRIDGAVGLQMLAATIVV